MQSRLESLLHVFATQAFVLCIFQLFSGRTDIIYPVNPVQYIYRILRIQSRLESLLHIATT